MGEIRLGCLLGQYDRAQSFDVASFAIGSGVHSWAMTGQCSWFFVGCGQTTHVHSSAQSLRIEVFSRAGSESVLSFDYGHADDAHARWFPEVDTHVLEASAWVLASPAPSSGGLQFRLFAQDEVYKPLVGDTYGTDPLRFLHLQTAVYSDADAPPRAGLHIPEGTAIHSQTTVAVDDVLTTVDAIGLHPEWSFEDRSRLMRAAHRTRAGYLHTLAWERTFAYALPLKFLSDSHAALLEWWWSRQFALLFTLDSSDGAARMPVRIANDRQPIGKRMRPYRDRWEGTLELESLTPGDLVF
jgi:hypothetical protein